MTAPVTVPFDGRLWTVQNVIQPSLNPLLRHAAGCCANPAREGVVQLCAAELTCQKYQLSGNTCSHCCSNLSMCMQLCNATQATIKTQCTQLNSVGCNV